MFRATDMFHSITQFVREAESTKAIDREPRRAEFEPDEIIGALMPVYSEIARRLPRNAYTSHGAT